MKGRNTIGMDREDRCHSTFTLASEGEVISHNTVLNTAVTLRECFENQKRSLFACPDCTRRPNIAAESPISSDLFNFKAVYELNFFTARIDV